jgi:hypothetical protein
VIEPGLDAWLALLTLGPTLGGCGKDPTLMVLRSARDGLVATGPDGNLGTLDVAACCILLCRPGDRAIWDADGAREEDPGRGREDVDAPGVVGPEREVFLVFGIGSAGKGVVGGPNEGLGSAVVAIVGQAMKARGLPLVVQTDVRGAQVTVPPRLTT